MSPVLDSVGLFRFHLFNECKMVSHCLIFHLSNYWWGWTSFYMSLIIHISSAMNCLFLIFCPSSFYHFVSVSLTNFNSLWLHVLQIPSSPSLFPFCLFTMPVVFFIEQSFKCSCIQMHQSFLPRTILREGIILPLPA